MLKTVHAQDYFSQNNRFKSVFGTQGGEGKVVKSLMKKSANPRLTQFY